MNIHPQDLGTKRHVEIVYRRAYTSGSGQPTTGSLTIPPMKPRIGFWGRYWSRGSELREDQAAVALPASGLMTSGSLYTVPILWVTLGGLITTGLIAKNGADPGTAGAVFTALSGVVAYLSALGSKRGFRMLHKPLIISEVEALSTGHDELERAYLSLVVHAIQQTAPPEAENQVQSALCALGDAISRLPVVPMPEGDAATLTQEAQALRLQARTEADIVVSESLERQAEALERRSETVRRSAQYARRTAAIRRELQAQIETLRASLAAFEAGAGEVSDLSEMADTVRRVAAEADAIADARTELDEYTSGGVTLPREIVIETQEAALPYPVRAPAPATESEAQLVALRRDNG